MSSRNTSHSENADRVQPGRIMILLKEAFVPDDVISDIVSQQGEVSAIHRNSHNPQLVFVQYVDHDVVEDVIPKLRNYPLFNVVDRALKSERYQEGTQKNQNKQRRDGNDGRNNNSRRNDGGFNNRNNEMDSPPKQASNRESQPDIPLGCWYCATMPSYECRCGAFYCDIRCQRADWSKHKDICMPRLVPISYSNQRILQEAVASKNSATSISSTPYSPSSPEYGNNHNGNNNQQQNRKQQSQQNRSNDFNGTGGQRNNQQQQQNNVQNRLASNGPRKNLQQQQNGQGSKQDNSSNQVNQVTNKLQRMKLARTGSTSSSDRPHILEPGRFPPEGARVKITTSLDSGTIYIYHNNGKHGVESEYQTLINRLTQAAGNASCKLSDVPKPDDVVFAPFQGMHYRAKVLAIKGDKMEVQFPDFGNIDTVAWRDALGITNEELKWAKYLTFPVTLEGVDGPLTKEQKQLLSQLEFEEEFELIKAEPAEDSEMQQVVLRRERQNVTLNMTLVEMKEKDQRQRRQREQQTKEKERVAKEEREKKDLAVKFADPDTYKPVIYEDSMKVSTLTQDKRYTLCIIDASEALEHGLISVIAAEDAPHYAAIVEECLRIGTADPNVYRPTVQGEVCLARYKEDWSRALYDEDGSTLLLDVGNLVNPDEFRRFPPGLGRTVYNNEVIVENLPLLQKMMKDGKPESIHGHTIDAWVAASESSQDTLGIRIIPSNEQAK